MAGEDIIMARQGELKRLHVIQKVLEKVLKQVEAAEMLSLSTRQIGRIVKRIRIEGEKGIIHRSRGKPSNHRIPKKMRDKVISLYRRQYGDFGPTLACEKLLERDGIKLSDETLRRWLLETGDWEQIRKGRNHRQWRERKAHLGEMVQMDGSQHDWLEGRGPRCVLMGYIDDATGKSFGRFYEYEGTIPAMESFRRYIQRYGLPLSVYLDKHTTYKSPAKPTIQDELNNTEPLSEFERALKELGVKVLHANSPQAKGRIERLFGTFQDRLVKEMRLRGIGSIEEANHFLEEYLPLYNKRFAVCPRGQGDLHRPIGKEVKLEAILCIKAERSLRNDFTVSYNQKLYQIDDKIRATKVMVHEGLDGSLIMTYRGQKLRFKEITTRPIKQQEAPRVIVRKRRRTRPAADHPWRRGFKSRLRRSQWERPIEAGT